MKRNNHWFWFIVPMFWACASVVAPTGGPKDEQAPMPEEMAPSNYAVHFDAKVIKMVFDEYIQVKNLENELIISPPLKKPKATVKGKLLLLSIDDTLKSNTTYTFNFGNAIVDLNEGNPIEDFKYVFSTGAEIDSLEIKGSVEPVFEKELPKDMWVMAYPINGVWQDSTPYKILPRYLSKLRNGAFRLSNMKEGKYKIVAFTDGNRDYLLDGREHIAFLSEEINLVGDSLPELKLRCYKPVEELKFKGSNVTSITQLGFGFNRTVFVEDSLRLVVNDTLIDLSYNLKRDSVFFSFDNAFDSCQVQLYYANQIDTNIIFYKPQDTLAMSLAVIPKKILEQKDSLGIRSRYAISNIDTSKIQLRKDSVFVDYEWAIDDNLLKVQFDREEDITYLLVADSAAITDIYGRANDSTAAIFKTRPSSYYGTLAISSQDTTAQLITLLDKKGGELMQWKVEQWPYTISQIPPGKYNLRVVKDLNQNGRWDAGDYLNGMQPEPCKYVKQEVEIRSNWDLELEINVW